jgi:hypothetical protein
MSIYGSQKCFPQYGIPIWSLWPNIRFLSSIFAEKNATKNVHICSMCIKINKVGKQEVGIWWVQKPLPTIWGTDMKIVTKYQICVINSCWEKCAYMFNVHKNQLSRQTGNRNLTGPKRYPQYGIPIWSLWPNIRFLPSIVAEKNAPKNILDGWTDRRTEVKQYSPLPLRGAGV